MDMSGFSKSFGGRLKEERTNLGLNQQEFADKCSIAKNTYFNYEKGERKPDIDIVMKFYLLGMDIFYLFTGVRNATASNYEERAMMKMFTSLDKNKQYEVLRYLDTLVAPKVQICDLNEEIKEDDFSKVVHVNQTASGNGQNNNQVFHGNVQEVTGFKK